MKPLIVLLIAFGVSVFVIKIFTGNYHIAWAGRIAMAVMLLFTAIAHFAFTKGMAMMLPGFIPYRTFFVYLTGVIEIAAAIGLVFLQPTTITGWLLIAFFCLMLPANIYAAVKQVDYQKANYAGNGLSYLWFRIPLQILFIFWVYYSAIKS